MRLVLKCAIICFLLSHSGTEAEYNERLKKKYAELVTIYGRINSKVYIIFMVAFPRKRKKKVFQYKLKKFHETQITGNKICKVKTFFITEKKYPQPFSNVQKKPL